MRINLRANGGVLDFFFPVKKKVRIEAVTAAEVLKGKKVLTREFCTFRALAWHYVLILPYSAGVFLSDCKNALDAALVADRLFYRRGAIAFDAATGQREAVGSTTMSFSHTASGSSRAIVGVVGIVDNAAPAGSTTVSAWTYGGETLEAQNDITNSVLEHIIQWTKSEPLSGANTLAITLSRSVIFRMQAISLSGTNGTVDVKGTLDAGTPASGAAYGGSITTTVANTLSISSSMLGNASGDTSLITVTTDAQTLAENGATGTNQYSVGSAYKNHTTSGAKSLQHTNADTSARRAVWAALAWQEGTQAITKTLSEAIVVADSLAKFPQKVLFEAVTIADTITRTISRALSDAIAVADTIAKTTGKVFSEAISLIDSIKRLFNGSAFLEEQAKNTTSWVNQSKNTPSFTGEAKSSTDWSNQAES